MPAPLARNHHILAASLAVLGLLATVLVALTVWPGADGLPVIGSTGAGPAQSAVRIAVSQTPLSAPVIIAQQQGFFRDAGIDVQLSEYTGGDRAFDAMIRGDADLATSSDSVVVFNSFKRQDFVLLGTFVRSDNDIKIIARNDQIKSAQDLTGTTAAVIKGSASEYFFRTFLTIEGVDPERVTTVGKAAEELQEALSSGEVDSIAAWEPVVYRALQKGPHTLSLLDTKGLYSLTFNLVASKRFADDQQQLISNLLRAIRRANLFIYAEPETAKDIIRTYLQLDKQFVEWIWADYLFGLTLNESLVLTLEEQANWVIDSGLQNAQQTPDFRLVIDSRAYNSMQRDLGD